MARAKVHVDLLEEPTLLISPEETVLNKAVLRCSLLGSTAIHGGGLLSCDGGNIDANGYFTALLTTAPTR